MPQDPLSYDKYSQGLFAIRGNLDGESSQEFTEKEQFIGLKISEEEFYLQISQVSEIVMLQPITFVPGSHHLLEGVLNLRGRIMPVINIRKMMGLERGSTTMATRIIITSYNDLWVGLIVDGITYVTALLPSEVENRTLPSKSPGADLISRIAKTNDRIIGVLDLTKITSMIDIVKKGEAAAIS